jgi:hypothetical protein
MLVSNSTGYLRELSFDAGLLNNPLLSIRPTLNNGIFSSTIACDGEHVLANILDGKVVIAQFGEVPLKKLGLTWRVLVGEGDSLFLSCCPARS